MEKKSVNSVKDEVQSDAAVLSSSMMAAICRLLLFALAIGTLFAFSVSKAVGLYVLVGGGFALLILYWMAAMLHHQERIDRALNRTDDTKDTE